MPGLCLPEAKDYGPTSPEPDGRCCCPPLQGPDFSQTDFQVGRRWAVGIGGLRTQTPFDTGNILREIVTVGYLRGDLGTTGGGLGWPTITGHA